MEAGANHVAAAAVLFAIGGILALLFLSETPQSASIAQASLSPENTLLIVSGEARNVTADKFSLCNKELCISVRSGTLPSARLLTNGRMAQVRGRVHIYRGSRYIEAERIEISTG